MNPNRQTGNRQSGFSLIEMMVVVLILGIISAGLFAQIDGAQQRAFSEQIKLDNFQEARDFVDQFFRDVNQIGYPNSRMIDTTAAWSPVLASPLINDNRLAIGLVKIDANEIPLRRRYEWRRRRAKRHLHGQRLGELLPCACNAARWTRPAPVRLPGRRRTGELK